jgi:uncharacterized membrane protein YukC
MAYQELVQWLEKIWPMDPKEEQELLDEYGKEIQNMSDDELLDADYEQDEKENEWEDEQDRDEEEE